jgi:hypothetical protein
VSIPELVYGHYLKVPVCKTDDYIFRFEEAIEGTFLHCDVIRWNKTVQQRLIQSWNSIADNHGGPIYVLNEHRDAKKAKFVRLLGFEWLCPHESHEIWIWRKNGQPL